MSLVAGPFGSLLHRQGADRHHYRVTDSPPGNRHHYRVTVDISYARLVDIVVSACATWRRIDVTTTTIAGEFN
jgi:hypothetical protein